MTFSPAFAPSFASGFGGRSNATAGRQSQNTHRSSTTLRILLQPSPSLPAGRQGYGWRSKRKSHIWAQLERNLGKLFYGGV